MLIGSTTERLALREEIDRAYEESGKIDQIKDASKQQEEIARIDIVNRRKKLREERAARVLPVPSIILHPRTCTAVQVRHISLGHISFHISFQSYSQGFNNAKCIRLDR